MNHRSFRDESSPGPIGAAYMCERYQTSDCQEAPMEPGDRNRMSFLKTGGFSEAGF